MVLEVEDIVIQKLTEEGNRAFFQEQTRTSSRPSDFHKECLLTLEEIDTLIDKCTDIVMSQPMLLELYPPVNICGDIHGQFLDLLWVFECGKFPPAANYLFLGDFVDRGTYSIETTCLLMSYKVKYPNRFFMLRGNHESNPVNEIYGFFVECATRFNKNLWHHFNEFFDCLPCAAVVGDKIFCVHGGLSPNLKNLDQIRKIPRPITTPVNGLLCDLVWADPDRAPSGWNDNTARAISYRFGSDVIIEFLKRMKMSLIVRAHEVMRRGYELMAKNHLITVFSAPNYTGVFANDGAILNVNEHMECTIILLNYKQKKEKAPKSARCEWHNDILKHRHD